jgi:hypothetical protein
MKIKLLFIIAVVSVYFTSCSLEGGSNYTPQIVLVRTPLLQNGDSLSFYYTDEGGVFRLDTMEVGDTVRFQLYMEGFSNNLLAFYIKDITEGAAKIILPEITSMDSIFLPTSDYNDGKFLMDGKSTSLFFPLRYVALKPSGIAKIQFTVVSDANFKDLWGSNTASITFKTPIIPKK